jgi:hypothetical protein
VWWWLVVTDRRRIRRNLEFERRGSQPASHSRGNFGSCHDLNLG